ncbi:MAG: tRNA (adenosine(37)-N6)-threonylcarbamoyltransferase complex dimerization subunit type 1 TsaB [Actinomycetota bacterium]|nr:MAG: tRNA (adenosine(37)-N6)-threonylcarbamoyltransferase complex dimerization subunit type 1 TsaB [Actinomycetota bacterium]
MILLGIDTATEMTSLGLCKYGTPPAVISFPGPKNQLESIGPIVRQLLDQSGISKSQIGAIALDVGPGLFTGLRVGVSFAKSLAGGLGIPIVPVSSLDIQAYPQGNCSRTIVSLVDARRGEVFYATYRKVPGGGVERLTSYSVASPEEVASEIESMAESVLLVGLGAIKYKDAFSTVSQPLHFAGSASAYPLMPVLFEIAFPLAFSEEFVSPESVEVIYIRDADAKVNFDVRQAFPKDR